MSRLVIELQNDQGKYNPDITESFRNAADAGIKFIDVLITVNDQSDSIVYTCEIVNHLPLGFKGTIWLYVKNDSYLWHKPLLIRGTYLFNLGAGIAARSFGVGYFSDREDWKGVLGSTGAGPSVLSGFPLWYGNSDSHSPNFDDFQDAGFGPWSKPTMKEFYGPTSLCGVKIKGLEYSSYIPDFGNILF